MILRHLPSAGTERVETGPIAFGDDWPGVFIRGDNACGYAGFVESAMHALQHPEEDAGGLTPERLAQALGSLHTLLMSCVPEHFKPSPAASSQSAA